MQGYYDRHAVPNGHVWCFAFGRLLYKLHEVMLIQTVPCLFVHWELHVTLESMLADNNIHQQLLQWLCACLISSS
jgi:predicted FMN-binding regulatory protein PaiB